MPLNDTRMDIKCIKNGLQTKMARPAPIRTGRPEPTALRTEMASPTVEQIWTL